MGASFFSNTFNAIQFGGDRSFFTTLAMKGHGKAVRLIADLLQ